VPLHLYEEFLKHFYSLAFATIRRFRLFLQILAKTDASISASEDFMLRTLAAPFIVLVAAGVLAACGGNHLGANGQSQLVQLPPLEKDLIISAVLPPHTIGAGYPDQLGHVMDKTWRADIAGFTQTKYSQTLGFPPGTKITIKNVSAAGEDHTFNVIATRTKPPANFPKNPKLLFTPHGGHILKLGFRSGVIHPGKSVTVTLVKGIYLIGCAVHYLSDNMRTVLVVETGAKPGPTATPPAAQ
jgi:hypothetical protein